jgi:hypothetical protein
MVQMIGNGTQTEVGHLLQFHRIISTSSNLELRQDLLCMSRPAATGNQRASLSMLGFKEEAKNLEVFRTMYVINTDE